MLDEQKGEFLENLQLTVKGFQASPLSFLEQESYWKHLGALDLRWVLSALWSSSSLGLRFRPSAGELFSLAEQARKKANQQRENEEVMALGPALDRRPPGPRIQQTQAQMADASLAEAERCAREASHIANRWRTLPPSDEAHRAEFEIRRLRAEQAHFRRAAAFHRERAEEGGAR